MPLNDLIALAPFVALAITAVVLLTVLAFVRDHLTTALLTLAGLGLSLATLPIANAVAPKQVTALLLVDRYALLFIGFILIAAFCTTVFSYAYLAKQAGHREEFYLLLVLATLGCAVLPASTHFAPFFLGIELISVPLYGLAAYLRHREISLEAGLKYLILAAVSSAFILFGMALVYAATGSLTFLGVASEARSLSSLEIPFLAGTMMIIAGVGFKLAVVPFHLWTPDVYEGAPAPVAAFIATASKGAVFALVLRYFSGIDFRDHGGLFAVLSVVSVASMLAGNILALLQTNVKRILAYSSIAHLGYVLLAVLAGEALARSAAVFYLAAYILTLLGAFGIVGLLSTSERDADRLDDYRGLSERHPFLALVFAVVLFSLAGLPVTAGFFAKFYLVSGAVNSGLWLPVAILLASSILGLFYYLRIVAVMFERSPESHAVSPSNAFSLAALGFLAAALIYFGLFPSWLVGFITR